MSARPTAALSRKLHNGLPGCAAFQARPGPSRENSPPHQPRRWRKAPFNPVLARTHRSVGAIPEGIVLLAGYGVQPLLVSSRALLQDQAGHTVSYENSRSMS